MIEDLVLTGAPILARPLRENWGFCGIKLRVVSFEPRARPDGLLEARGSQLAATSYRTANVYPALVFAMSYTPKSQLYTVHASVGSAASVVDVQ